MTPLAGRTVERRRTLHDAMGHLRDGRLDEAGALLRTVLDRHATDPDALHLQGLWHHERGESGDAERSLRAAIARWPVDDPQVFIAWNNLGNVLVESGRAEDAEQAYRTALERAPGAGGTWTNLAGLLRRQGRLPEAHDAARRATEASPDDPQGWFTLARVLVERGDVTDGLVANARGIALAPRGAIGREEVLRSLTLLGHRDEAASLWREWLAERPDDPVARHHEAACSDRPVDRASDAYVTAVFDGFASSFDARLTRLGYQAPQLVAAALVATTPPPPAAPTDPTVPAWSIVGDLGCGTGLVGELLRPVTRSLVGVDLSPGMLEYARRRGHYDQIVCAELTGFLRANPARFDALVAADVLCYFGVLDDVIGAARAALRPGGVLVFTVEASRATGKGEGVDWTLTMTGRYLHHRGYVSRLMAVFGEVAIEDAVLRTEAGRPVQGLVVRGRRPPAASSR